MQPESNLTVRPTQSSGSANGRPTRPPGSESGRPIHPSSSNGDHPARTSESDGGRPLHPRVKRQAFGSSDNKCSACINVPIIDPDTGVCNQ